MTSHHPEVPGLFFPFRPVHRFSSAQRIDVPIQTVYGAKGRTRL